MRYAKNLFFFILIILYAGCDKNGVGFIQDKSLNYPTQLNNEWEYSTDMHTDYLDSLGRVSHSQSISFGNTIVKIAGINELVGNHNGLTRFESHDLSGPGQTHTMWYLNNDSGLTAIAYNNVGVSQLVYPKASFEKRLIYSDNLRMFSLLPAENYTLYNIEEDSIFYYDPPRLVIKYPMQIGIEWTELQSPFFRKRIITGQEFLQTDIGNLLCYKIDSEMSGWNLRLIDFISKDHGLLKREIIADSMVIRTVENPDGIGYANSRTVSVIKRIKK